MDLERELVEDNEVTWEKPVIADGNKIQNNVSSTNGNSGEHVSPTMLTNDDRAKQTVTLPPNLENSPAAPGGSSPKTTKGCGLKRWRRIKRDHISDASPILDSSKALKRGLSNSGIPSESPHMRVKGKQSNEGPSVSANLDAGDYFTRHDSSPESRMAVCFAFSGTNSENSNSKSSTAASIPKARYDMPAISGHGRDKNRLKNHSSKILGTWVQRSQQGKNRAETTKKPRGERVKIDKENSHSSLESDSRTSNFVFTHGAFSAISNGKQSEKSINYDGYNSDEAQTSEQQLSNEFQSGYGRENMGEAEGLSREDLGADMSWKKKEKQSENNQHFDDQDPLFESIFMLQHVQEVLEKELEKFSEIEMESPVGSLTQKVSSLESKLEEARAALEAKGSKLVELELVLNRRPSSHKEMEAELENFLKQKIEAEIKCLAITRSDHNPTTLAAGAEEQAALQNQMASTLEAAKGKAELLEKQAEELDACCEDIIRTEEIAQMRERARKVSWCLFVQLILLVLVFGLFVLQLSPEPEAVMPT